VRRIRHLIGPSIVLALAIALGAGIGATLASRDGQQATPSPREAQVMPYAVVDGPALATQVVATVQAKETLTGRSAGINQEARRGPLGVCVHNASGQPLDAAEIGARIATAHNTALNPPGPITPGVTERRIEDGGQIAMPCPSEPPLLAAGVTGIRHESIVGAPSFHVVYASGFRYFVFVVPEETIRQFFSDSDVRKRKFTQEKRCVVDVCAQFGQAYCVSPSEFRDAAFLTDLMADAFSLFRRQPGQMPPLGPAFYETRTPSPR
jgi:hypothetical protein